MCLSVQNCLDIVRFSVGFQVGTDPAGDGDAEGGGELLQRADQGADLHVQEQVKVLLVLVLMPYGAACTRAVWASVLSFHLHLFRPQLAEGH